MRREPEHFGDEELALVYIARKLKEALSVEKVLTEAGLDYLVEADKYKGGIIFQTERVGAFFYVDPGNSGAARETLIRGGFEPYDVGA